MSKKQEKIETEADFLGTFLKESVGLFVKNKCNEHAGYADNQTIKNDTKRQMIRLVEGLNASVDRPVTKELNDLSEVITDNIDKYINKLDHILSQSRDQELSLEQKNSKSIDPLALDVALVKVAAKSSFAQTAEILKNKEGVEQKNLASSFTEIVKSTEEMEKLAESAAKSSLAQTAKSVQNKEGVEKKEAVLSTDTVKSTGRMEKFAAFTKRVSQNLLKKTDQSLKNEQETEQKETAALSTDTTKPAGRIEKLAAFVKRVSQNLLKKTDQPLKSQQEAGQKEIAALSANVITPNEKMERFTTAIIRNPQAALKMLNEDPEIKKNINNTVFEHKPIYYATKDMGPQNPEKTKATVELVQSMIAAGSDHNQAANEPRTEIQAVLDEAKKTQNQHEQIADKNSPQQHIQNSLPGAHPQQATISDVQQTYSISPSPQTQQAIVSDVSNQLPQTARIIPQPMRARPVEAATKVIDIEFPKPKNVSLESTIDDKNHSQAQNPSIDHNTKEASGIRASLEKNSHITSDQNAKRHSQPPQVQKPPPTKRRNSMSM